MLPRTMYWDCVGRTWFSHQKFWFSLFVVMMILREIVDNSLLNMNGIRKLCINESRFFFCSIFWWIDEKVSLMLKAILRSNFWFFFSCHSFLLKNDHFNCSFFLNMFWRLFLNNRGDWIFCHLWKGLFMELESLVS